MYSSKTSVTLLLSCFLLVLGLSAGCGGAEQSSENQNGSDNSGASQEQADTSQQQADETSREQGAGATDPAGGSPSEVKIALGDILSIDAEKRRLVLKPVEGERQIFRVVPGANVTLDDAPAELSNLEQGQQAQIRYVTRNDRERARAVSAFGADETSQ